MWMRILHFRKIQLKCQVIYKRIHEYECSSQVSALCSHTFSLLRTHCLCLSLLQPGPCASPTLCHQKRKHVFHRQVSLSLSWLPCKQAEQLPKASPASPSRCSAKSDLWRLGLAKNVLPEQPYWLQYEKITSAAAKIRLKKSFYMDTDRREILSV